VTPTDRLKLRKAFEPTLASIKIDDIRVVAAEDPHVGSRRRRPPWTMTSVALFEDAHEESGPEDGPWSSPPGAPGPQAGEVKAGAAAGLVVSGPSQPTC